MKRLIKRLHIGFLNTCRIWRDEYTYVFRDYGVLLFFFALPFAYPVVYALIYNTELVRDVPMAVVDDCRTPLSRQLVRDMDASPDVKNISYCANMEEAKRLMYKREYIINRPSFFKDIAPVGDWPLSIWLTLNGKVR